VLYLEQHRSVDTVAPIAATGTPEALADKASGRDILPWMELQSRLDVKWDAAKHGESPWHRLKSLYARLARPSEIDDIVAFPEEFDLRLRDAQSDRTYYFAGTSSGERLMLRLAANLTAWGAWRSVILIDEIELHLHRRWQRNLLHFCRQGGEGDNQFIVTTHSEDIVRYVDPDTVIDLGSLDD